MITDNHTAYKVVNNQSWMTQVSENSKVGGRDDVGGLCCWYAACEDLFIVTLCDQICVYYESYD